MFRSSCSRLAGLLALAVMAAAPSAVSAGPGHDHEPEPAAAAGPGSPRVVAVSESYELVGILKDGRLTVYLDRLADTSPVSDAKIELSVAGETAIAKRQPDGTYVFTSPVLRKRRPRSDRHGRARR